MTLQEKNNLLLRLQCLHGQYGNTLAHAMSVGKCTEKHLCINTKSYYSIEALRRYQPFLNGVTNAGKVILLRSAIGTDVTVEIFVDNVLLGSYTGTEGELGIINYLQNVINASTNIHGYISFSVGNVLYLYTYENTEDFNSVILGTFNENQVVVEPSLHIASTTLKNKLEEILDIWNCITTVEFCNIVKSLKNTLSNEC